MNATARRRLGWLLVILATIGRGDAAPRDPLPSPRETMRGAGVRLSRMYSERVLTAVASRGPELLARLTASERRALSEGYCRFDVDRPVVVDVAAPADATPFWLADRGFVATGHLLTNDDATWQVYRRTFDRGPVGLGVNGLDITPSAHYVVFVRELAARTRTAPSADSSALEVRLTASCRPLWRATIARPGVSAALDVYRPFAEIPAELTGAVLLQPSYEARHSTRLATSRVWKTHVVSGPVPDQVAISYGTEAGRELVFTWRTSDDVTASAVRIAPATSSGTRALDPGAIRVVTGESSAVETANVLNDPVIRRHRVAVGGLEPSRAYVYSLGDGANDGWTDWRTVATAPGPDRAVRFLYLGDAQTGLEGWGRLLATAARQASPADFLILAGDLVDRGNERTNWDHFFLRAAGVFDRLPVMPCAGNHEYLDVGPRLYRANFALPSNGPPGIDAGLVYSFEASDAFFAVLDSTLAVWDPAMARRQAEWLDSALARTRARWKIAVFHHPVYPSHPWRDMPALREHWVPVFDRHHVDLVLQGHDHSYQRTHPLRNHHRATGPERGTIYLIAVSGDKYVEGAHRDGVAKAMSHVSTYQAIEVDPATRRLTYEARTADGRLVDSFAITK
ncbi:MAG: purple acid phosphatase family protein [Isosphaeraceae bacterium]